MCFEFSSSSVKRFAVRCDRPTAHLSHNMSTEGSDRQTLEQFLASRSLLETRTCLFTQA